MLRTVPAVEVPDDGDALGVGRPHGEEDPRDTTDGHRMGTELLVQAEMAPLVEQVNVERVEQADPQDRLGSPRQAIDRAGRHPPSILPERRQGFVHRRIVHDLLQRGRCEAVPVRPFRACSGQVDRVGLPDQVVELNEHEPGVATGQLAMDGGEHGGRRPRAVERVALLGAGLFLSELGEALSHMGPFGPLLVGRRDVQLAALDALVDVSPAPPAGERGQIVGRERGHRTGGRCLQHRLAVAADGELRDVGTPDACGLHALANLVVDGAKVLADDVRMVALCLDRQYGQQLFERHLHVDTVAGLGSAGDPEQPLQSHYVIDAQHPGHTQVVRQRGAELLVTVVPERLGRVGGKPHDCP